jgi:Uncharacterised nucleotidyltransferase
MNVATPTALPFDTAADRVHFLRREGCLADTTHIGLLGRDLLSRGRYSNESETFFTTALGALRRANVPFMIGGAYAMRTYGGIFRDTKDLDVFCRPQNVRRVLTVLRALGCRIERTHPRWLAKAFSGTTMIDVIFSSSNGRCRVDETWHRHARETDVLGVSVEVIPPEEMIWSKAYVQDRFRFDGADVAHIIRRQGRRLDWHRLLDRMDHDWEVLLAHLVTFHFIYPSDRRAVPTWVMRELGGRLDRQLDRRAPRASICRGRMLTPHDYEIDVAEWGYRDGSRMQTGRGRSNPAHDRAHRRPG